MRADGELDLRGAAPDALLPWQGALLAAMCGILSIRFPVPGAACLLLLGLGWGLLGGGTRALRAFLPAFGLGIVLAWSALPAVPALPGFVGSGEVVRLEGIVHSVESRPDERLTVLLESARCSDEAVGVELPGLVSWSWHSPSLRPEPGRTVRLDVRVDPVGGFANPGSWDYAFYQRTRSVFPRIYSQGTRNGLEFGPAPEFSLHRARNAILEAVASSAPGQGGAMLAALLTGDRFRLEQNTVDLLRRAGLSHTLALSGLHLGFVAALGTALAWGLGVLFPSLLLRVPRPKLAALISTPLVLSYLWLGQFSPSLVRAACMFAFWGALLLMGRGRVLLDGLFFALAIILAFSPLSLFDIRLQLSAVAVAGIATFLPTAHRFFSGRLKGALRLLLPPADLFLLSVCAMATLLPLTARTFGMGAPNLLLNVLWVPVLGMVCMPLALLGAAALPLLPDVGGLLLSLAGKLLAWMLGILSALDAAGMLPVVQLLRPLWPEMLGAALLLACLAAALRGRGEGRRFFVAVGLGIVLLAGPHVAVMAQDSGDRVRLSVVDVGQGQALVVSLPGGRRVVVDGGGLRSSGFDTGRDLLAPVLTLGRPPRIDTVILSHPHADHYKGLLHLLNHFEVRSFAYGHGMPGGRYREPFRDALRGADLTPRRLFSGDVLDFGGGVSLRAVHPTQDYRAPTTNDGSLVLLLERNGRGLALLPGDVEQDAIAAMLETHAPMKAEALVLPHHGSITSFSERLYEIVDPSFALCSGSQRNSHRQPAADILEVLGRRSVLVLTTPDSGLIELVWDGRAGQGRVFETLSR